MAKAKKSSKDTNLVIRYIREVRSELNKVTWASTEEAVNLTIVVTIVTVVISLFLGSLDLIFGRLVEFLIVAL